ncbi:hypothetical protein EJ04DRAFT_136026 [Polyplosphaeria fusca]|uniref:DUF676 domain-containing protein n=1 Tax=Polyplosphaeria fusca TaxID=682080 RepID=A0A9P4R5B0_9PLEO|nr:hypothetical protein EJ04DRAFT_136026 [Polyplosphaeria fusca]
MSHTHPPTQSLSFHGIFVILGVEDPPVEEWSVAHCRPLVNDLIGSSPAGIRIDMLVAEHSLSSETLKSWDQLLTQAKELLQLMIDFQGRPNSRGKPIIFICHSLGDVILKRLLVLAHWKDSSKGLIDALAGIVFLGTPHLRADNLPKWSNVLGILHTRMKSPSDALMNAGAAQPLVVLSSEFEDLTLQVDVLSTTELKEQNKTQLA